MPFLTFGVFGFRKMIAVAIFSFDVFIQATQASEAENQRSNALEELAQKFVLPDLGSEFRMQKDNDKNRQRQTEKSDYTAPT
jgi:hypothetical protein